MIISQSSPMPTNLVIVRMDIDRRSHIISSKASMSQRLEMITMLPCSNIPTNGLKILGTECGRLLEGRLIFTLHYMVAQPQPRKR